MKENKWGIRISYMLTILSWLGSILIKNSWWQNFCFAILGGSLFSNIICIVNYVILLKSTAESIALGTYSLNNFGFASLFSSDKDIRVEKAVEVLNILNDKLYYVYVKSYDLYKSLFWFDKRKKKVIEIKHLIDEQLIYVYEIESYIETFTNEAINNTNQLYKDLYNFIDNNHLYLESLKIARTFHSEVNSLEEVKDKNKIKKDCADKYKMSIKK